MIPEYKPGQMRVFVQSGSPEVKIVREFLVFDSNDVVSAVGGSMGLFLGFSFLAAFSAALKAADKICCCRGKRKKIKVEMDGEA